MHVDDLVRLVMAANVDGIDLDYEALPSNIRDESSAFVTLLANVRIDVADLNRRKIGNRVNASSPE